MRKSPPSTRVWTPSDDPRTAGKSEVSLPVAKEPPSVRIHKPAPVAAPKPAEARVVPAPSAAPKASAPSKPEKTRRAPAPRVHQQMQQTMIAALAQEHGICLDHARLVHQGVWTLEQSRRRTYELAQTKVRAGKISEGQVLESQQLEQWIKAATPLVRIEAKREVRARLEQVETFQWSWSDSAEPLPKLGTLAVLSEESHALWSPHWEFDLGLQARKLEVQANRKERPRFNFWRMFNSLSEGYACELYLINGIVMSGYLRWVNHHSLGFSQTLEETSPFLFAPFHGVFAYRAIQTEAVKADEPNDPTPEVLSSSP